eukprot:403349477
MYSSKQCINECLNSSNHNVFCATDETQGYCCSDYQTCQSLTGTNALCSVNITNSQQNQSQKLVCPQSNYCNNYTVDYYPQSDGTILTFKQEPTNLYINDICKYTFRFRKDDPQMNNQSFMTLSMNYFQNAQAIYMYSGNFNEAINFSGNLYNFQFQQLVYYPYDFYVVFTGDQEYLPMSFDFTIHYGDFPRDPNQDLSQSNGSDSTVSVKTILIATLVPILIITACAMTIFILCCCCNQKSKQNRKNKSVTNFSDKNQANPLTEQSSQYKSLVHNQNDETIKPELMVGFGINDSTNLIHGVKTRDGKENSLRNRGRDFRPLSTDIEGQPQNCVGQDQFNIPAMEMLNNAQQPQPIIQVNQKYEINEIIKKFLTQKYPDLHYQQIQAENKDKLQIPQHLQPDYLKWLHENNINFIDFENQGYKEDIIEFILKTPYLPSPMAASPMGSDQELTLSIKLAQHKRAPTTKQYLIKFLSIFLLKIKQRQ